MPPNHTTTCYLQVTADTWDAASGPKVRSIRIVGVNQKRPRAPKPGAVVIALTIEMPDDAFLPLSPAATVVVPLALVDTEPVVVEAVEP